jgi:hypothetical protein
MGNREAIEVGVKFNIVNPVYTVVGSCDDTDPTNGPGKSYGPENKQADSCTDGNSVSDAAGLLATALNVRAIAQTAAHSIGRANANAKALAKSTLSVEYSLFERALALLGWFKPKLKILLVSTLNADVNDGPCGAGCTVFITNGPGGASPVPNWQQTFGFSQKPGDPTMLKVTPDAVQIPNPGQVVMMPDGPTFRVLHGNYDLTFECNAVATADGKVSVFQVAILIISQA